MKLGILVNTDLHMEDIIGLTRAFSSHAHEVLIFAMDEGTRLLEQRPFTDLSRLNGVVMSYCDHSAQRLKVNVEGLSQEITCGSQYNNAVMMHNADRVIVL